MLSRCSNDNSTEELKDGEMDRNPQMSEVVEFRMRQNVPIVLVVELVYCTDNPDCSPHRQLCVDDKVYNAMWCSVTGLNLFRADHVQKHPGQSN